MSKIAFGCIACEKVFLRWPSLKAKYCSRSCFASYRDSGAMLEANAPQWKGNSVGYWGLHKWVEKHLGKPKICEFCKSSNNTKYEWANRSGKYKRELSDWLRLCTKCHRKYDFERTF